jgi:hypothetical protein
MALAATFFFYIFDPGNSGLSFGLKWIMNSRQMEEGCGCNVTIRIARTNLN